MHLFHVVDGATGDVIPHIFGVFALVVVVVVVVGVMKARSTLQQQFQVEDEGIDHSSSQTTQTYQLQDTTTDDYLPSPYKRSSRPAIVYSRSNSCELNLLPFFLFAKVL